MMSLALDADRQGPEVQTSTSDKSGCGGAAEERKKRELDIAKTKYSVKHSLFHTECGTTAIENHFIRHESYNPSSDAP